MDEDGDIDIAAAMGFASFGNSKKKRKHDLTNSPNTKTGASGANSTQLGTRSKKTVTDEDMERLEAEDSTALGSAPIIHQKPTSGPPGDTGLASFLARGRALPENSAESQSNPNIGPDVEQAPEEMMAFGGPAISKSKLNALRFGLRNKDGDNAYFLPSFVEDPWEKLHNAGR